MPEHIGEDAEHSERGGTGYDGDRASPSRCAMRRLMIGGWVGSSSPTQNAARAVTVLRSTPHGFASNRASRANAAVADTASADVTLWIAHMVGSSRTARSASGRSFA